METEIGTSDNYNNFAIGPMTEPFKYLNHDRLKPGPKLGKAAKKREYEDIEKIERYEQWLSKKHGGKLEYTHHFDIYKAYKDGGGLVCFAQYDCGDSKDCLGYIFDGSYTLVCSHCLEQIVKEKENV